MLQLRSKLFLFALFLFVCFVVLVWILCVCVYGLCFSLFVCALLECVPYYAMLTVEWFGYKTSFSCGQITFG